MNEEKHICVDIIPVGPHTVFQKHFRAQSGACGNTETTSSRLSTLSPVPFIQFISALSTKGATVGSVTVWEPQDPGLWHMLGSATQWNCKLSWAPCSHGSVPEPKFPSAATSKESGGPTSANPQSRHFRADFYQNSVLGDWGIDSLSATLTDA